MIPSSHSVHLRLESWRTQRLQEEMTAAKKRAQDEEDRALKEQELEDMRSAREAMRDREKLDHLIGKMVF